MLPAARVHRHLRCLSTASLSSIALPEVAQSHVRNGDRRDEGAHPVHPPLSLDLARRQAELEQIIAQGFEKKRGRPSKKLDGKLERASALKGAKGRVKKAEVTEHQAEETVEAEGVAQAIAKKKPARKPRTTSKVAPNCGEEITTASKARTKPLSKPADSKEISGSIKVPARLLPPHHQKHHDLPSYLFYADRSDIDKSSHIYRGTHYEYTVAASLSDLGFTLHRTAGSNDLGVDFVGYWSVPDTPEPLKILLQCKLSRPAPALVRELEGAFTGAPAGWTGDGVLAVLASTKPSTQGVRAAVQRSKRALVLMQVSEEGIVKQVLWNFAAREKGLEGLGVVVRYAVKKGGVVEDEGEGGVGESIGLTWMGEMWRPNGAARKVRETGTSVKT